MFAHIQNVLKLTKFATLEADVWRSERTGCEAVVLPGSAWFWGVRGGEGQNSGGVLRKWRAGDGPVLYASVCERSGAPRR